MKSKTNWWEIGVVVAILIAIFYAGCRYGISSVIKENHIDTTITKDSFIVRYKPVPYKVDSFIYLKGKPFAVHDTTPGEVIINPVDTAAILHRFSQVAYYDDSSTEAGVGWRINDTLFQNRIIGRRVMVSCSDTIIKSITTLKEPKKIIAYLNLSVIGNFNNYLYGSGIGLGVKAKNDIYFGVNAWVIKEHKPMISGSVSLPIKITKRK